MDTVAKVTPLLTSEWQSLQDPGRRIDNPDEGKFVWDGKFLSDTDLIGSWNAVAKVRSIDDYVAGHPKAKISNAFSKLTFKKEGKTDKDQMIWTSGRLLDLEKGQALIMTTKEVHGKKLLFVEEGGFNVKHPVSWKSPLIVFSKE